ncbi:MAG: hypothetical protein ABSB41_06205 [Anaerolineales bacterium]
MIGKGSLRSWAARTLIGLVVLWNLQAAFAFLAAPGQYAPAFELAGVPGQAAVRGVAVLFIMWNVPYLVAAWQPRRNRLALAEALGMQLIGLIGEGFILSMLGAGHAVLRASILRFITFDAAGLGLLVVAFVMARN